MLSRTSGFLERRASYVPPQFNTVWSNTTNHWCFHHKYMETFALVLNVITQISVLYNFPSWFVMLATWFQFFRLGYKSLANNSMCALSKTSQCAEYVKRVHKGQNNKQCNFELVYILRQCMIHCELSSIRVQMTHYLWCAIPKKWCHLFLQTNWWGTSFTTAALSWLDSKLNLFRKFLFLFLLISFFFFYLIEISISCINR